jgi:C1A family cysteine protease
VANKNAVAAMINAGDLSSYVESDGTFTDCKRFELNHAITIVGKTENAEWIVRNSWGKNWGANGYFTMGHGNTCGVCLHAIVPVLRMDSNNTLLPYS